MNANSGRKLMLVSTAAQCTATFKHEVGAGRSLLGLYSPTDEANRKEFATRLKTMGRRARRETTS